MFHLVVVVAAAAVVFLLIVLSSRSKTCEAQHADKRSGRMMKCGRSSSSCLLLQSMSCVEIPMAMHA